LNLAAGIHANIPMDVYINDPAPDPSLSTGIAKALLNECPLAAWHCHPRLNSGHEGEDTTATDIGRIAHSVLLEGDTSKVSVIDPDDYPGKKGGIPDGWTNDAIRSARDAARAAGKIPILRDKWPAIEAMVEIAKHNFSQMEARIGFKLSEMLTERTILWQEGGVWCRSRPDLMTPDYSLVIDFKTTDVSVHPDTFGRQITNMGYDLQAALIRNGVYAITGKTPDVVFWAQQVSSPHLSSFVGMDPTFCAISEKKLSVAIARWNECIQKSEWPGYPADICWVQPPPWELAKWESSEIEPMSSELLEQLERVAP